MAEPIHTSNTKRYFPGELYFWNNECFIEFCNSKMGNKYIYLYI